MEDNNSIPQRILILGKSGSGKTTLARHLSTLLSIPHIELDTLFWNPGWTKTPPLLMRQKVDTLVTPHGSWVVDGNYRAYADITWQRAELIIWLDFPIVVNLWRLVCRSVWRMWSRERCCGENYESGRALLWPTVEYNILICCWYEWRKHAKEYPRFIGEYGEGKVVVLRSQNEVDVWMESFRGRVKLKEVEE